MIIRNRAIGFVPRARQRLRAPFVTPLVAFKVGFGLRPHDRQWIGANLPHRAQIVANQPFFDDPVFAACAVGDRHDARRSHRRRTEQSVVAEMRRTAHDPVRAVETAVVVRAPDHILANDLAVGRRSKRGDRVLNHRFDTDDGAGQGVNLAILAIMGPA